MERRTATGLPRRVIWMRDRRLNEICAKTPWWARGLALAGLALLVILAPGEERAFIYFQF